EVTHGKASLIGKMPGDDWRKFANLRALFGYMNAQSGKKLLFMGSEFGQWNEWYHETSLDWNLLEYPSHGGLQHWVQDLNATLKSRPALLREPHPSRPVGPVLQGAPRELKPRGLGRPRSPQR